jgi:hypothetical protein|tara:strand:+ start:598 stop:747 length:150 start_codon:yes stop_codon:yes gene_type:complete
VAKIIGVTVSRRNDITGKDEPQKKTVDRTARTGIKFFIRFLILKKSFYR